MHGAEGAAAAILALVSLGCAAGLERSRVITILAGERTESNTVLFDFAKLMDLRGIAGLGDAYPKGIPLEELIKGLPPAVEGWEKGASHGFNMALPAGSVTVGSCSYTRGDAAVTIAIWDTMNLAEGPWTTSIPAGNVDVETAEGYVRYRTLEGYPTCEVRNHGERSGTLIIALVAQPVPEGCWLSAVLILLGAWAIARRPR